MKVKIESLAAGGAGIARNDGKVYFVTGGLPEDVLEIKVVKDKGSFAEAVVKEIIEPSPDRVDAGCPVFDLCGGCQLQNLRYVRELHEKENIFRETLRRIGGFNDINIEPIHASPENYGYRNRVTLSAFFYKGKWHVGYNQKRSNRKVKIDRCPVSESLIEAAIGRISRVLSSIGDPSYSLEKIQIASNGVNSFITLVAKRGRKADSLNALTKHLKRYKETENSGILGEGECEFEYECAGYKFLSRPSVFSQANPGVNLAMVETVLEWAGSDGSDRVLDLYSGTGNFSLPLSAKALSVDAVEINPRAVNLARRSAQINNISNITFDAQPAESFIREVEKGLFDTILLDPPREGAKDSVPDIARISPAKVIYVSCDPATLARDLKGFSGLGYELSTIRPFDMFP